MRLLLLAESIQETLQRYAIVLTRMLAQPTSRRSSWKRTA
jgi:glycerol-3-phosphate O-acyltransferase